MLRAFRNIFPGKYNPGRWFLSTGVTIVTFSRVIMGFLFFYPSAALSQETTLVTYTPRKGETLESFFKYYRLDPSDCNRTYFYRINETDSNFVAASGKKVHLPILVYDYNGKSIRSTIGNDDLPLANRIKAYNDLVVKLKLKTALYLTDNKLWVPYDYLGCKQIQPLNDSPGQKKTVHSPEKKATRDEKPPVKNLAPSDPKQPTGIIKKPEKEVPKEKEPQPPEDEVKSTGTTGKTKVYSIFGKDNEKITVNDEKLKGCVFYLDPGHGGPDPGAIGKYGKNSLCEDEYAYDITLRLAKNLLEHGAAVYVIIVDPNDGIRSAEILKPDKDEMNYDKSAISLRQIPRLNQRVNMINKLYKENKAKGFKYQYQVTIHIDSRAKGKMTDIFFYYNPEGKTGKKLAETLYKTIEEKYGKHRKNRAYKGTIEPRNLHMLRKTHPPAVYIELGNIRNSSDQKRFILENNRQAVANWLRDGIVKFNNELRNNK